ncbi:DUF7239 family protein [Mycolicibacterium vulneris]
MSSRHGKRDQIHALRRAVRDAEDKVTAHLCTVEKSDIWDGDYENPVYNS